MDFTEIVRIFAEKGGVQNLHLYEGANIHDNNIENLYTYNISSEELAKMNGDMLVATSDEQNDPLFKVLFGNVRLYRDVVAAAGRVSRPSDFKHCIRPVLKSHGFSKHNFNLYEFYEAIIPHMTCYKCSKSVSALLRSCEI